MPIDDLKLLAQQLERLQAEVAQRMQAEPFEGFAGSLQQFRAALQDAGAEIAELDAMEAQAAAQAAAAEKEPEPTIDEILGGGEVCRGLEHIVGVVPARTGPETILPDVRTPVDVVERMLTLASVGKNDTVYDLGCCDGRIPVQAAEKFGARGTGIELLPDRVQLARSLVQLKKLDHSVTILEGDVLKADLSKATVVTLFISKGIMLRLRDKLRSQLPVGARIVSHGFDMGDWRPHKTLLVNDRSGHRHRLYLWTIDDRCKRATDFSEDWEFWDDWSHAND